MKTILLNELSGREIDELRVLSVSHSLYMARAVLNGTEYRVRIKSGASYKANALENVREDFSLSRVKKMTVTHNSAYDEMVGQAVRTEPNTLVYEVSPAPLQ